MAEDLSLQGPAQERVPGPLGPCVGPGMKRAGLHLAQGDRGCSFPNAPGGQSGSCAHFQFISANRKDKVCNQISVAGVNEGQVTTTAKVGEGQETKSERQQPAL